MKLAKLPNQDFFLLSNTLGGLVEAKLLPKVWNEIRLPVSRQTQNITFRGIVKDQLLE